VSWGCPGCEYSRFPGDAQTQSTVDIHLRQQRPGELAQMEAPLLEPSFCRVLDTDTSGARVRGYVAWLRSGFCSDDSSTFQRSSPIKAAARRAPSTSTGL
jgi:hypothetical protein